MREIKYKNILWEKTYYQNELIDESKDLRGKETNKWSGIMFLFRFSILGGAVRNRFIILPLLQEYGGNNEQEMVDDLETKTKDLSEWCLKGRNWKEANLFPEEVNQKLLEYHLEKYVKKVS